MGTELAGGEADSLAIRCCRLLGGRSFSMSVLLVAGFVVFVAGLVTIAFGIPIKEFSFGDTLVVSGAVGPARA